MKRKSIYSPVQSMETKELIQVLECQLKDLNRSAKEDKKLGWLGAQSTFMLGVLENLKGKLKI